MTELTIADEGRGITRAASKLPEQIKTAAIRTICHYAETPTEATELMKMLGIHPSQDDERA